MTKPAAMGCDCCNAEPMVGVAAVPFMPMSIAWGRKCLDANVVPYDLAVAMTAMIGGVDQGVEEWRGYVDRTLAYFHKSPEQWAADVEEELAHQNAAAGIEEQTDGPQ